MQGHKSSITTFPENLSFDHSLTSSDAAIQQQISWNGVQNHLPECIVSSGENNAQIMHQTRHESSTLDPSFGETSSSAGQGQVDHIERKGAEPANDVALDNDGTDSRASGKQIASGSSPSGSVVFPRNLDIGHHEHDDDDSQVIEQGSLMFPSQCVGFGKESEGVPGSSFDGPRSSCKRKAVESTDIGSSSSADQNDAGNSIITPAQIELGNNNETGQGNNPRPRLDGVYESVSIGSPRNVRLRIDDSLQQDRTPEITFLNNPAAESLIDSRGISGLNLPNDMFESNHATEDRNIQESSSVPLSHVPYVRLNSQSMWGVESLSSASEESNSAATEDLITRDQNPSRDADHSVLSPAVETGNSSQEPSNANSYSENNERNSSPANAGSSHRAGPSRNTRPEIVRAARFLLSSLSTEAVGQRERSNRVMLPGSSSSSSPSLQEAPPSSGNSSIAQRRLEFLERFLDNSPGLPHSSRSVASSGEGRSGLMSEHVRQFFDLMRREDGVRFEEVMLDPSILFNMADLNDRHRDMRMDVDDMSYEELLALGERIGNVCTGLKEGIISTHLKQHKFVETQPKIETEPCSICREEYSEGEDIGTLDCGHDFHTDCVKQWLMQKNLCPVCKTTGLNHHK